MKFDLTPEADGSLTLPLNDFAGCQFLEITASDRLADDMLILALPASETPLRDRRIARPLDPGNTTSPPAAPPCSPRAPPPPSKTC